MIAMANWTPTGFVGQMFKIVGSHVTPPQNMPSPLLWGSETAVRERLGDEVSEINFERRLISFTFPFGVTEKLNTGVSFMVRRTKPLPHSAIRITRRFVVIALPLNLSILFDGLRLRRARCLRESIHRTIHGRANAGRFEIFRHCR